LIPLLRQGEYGPAAEQRGEAASGAGAETGSGTPAERA
jgi:hypothetical protein